LVKTCSKDESVDIQGGVSMRIILETEYAIQIIDYLIHCGKRQGAIEISEAIGTPLRFTKNILQKLAHTDIINSYLGNHGGYELGRPPEEISLYDVMEVTEGPLLLNRCLANEHECAYIPDKQQCPFHVAFRELSSGLERHMRQIRFTLTTYCGGGTNAQPLGDSSGRSDKQELIKEHDCDGTDICIIRLQQKHEELVKKYEELQKENARLRLQIEKVDGDSR